MNIVVNTRGGHLEPGLTFLKQTFACLVNNHPEHQFIFLADTGISGWIPVADNVTISDAGGILDQAILIRWWHYYRLPVLLKKYKADILINANGICCLRASLPQFLLLSDETCLHLKRSKKHVPGNLSRKKISRNNLATYIQKASAIMVVSEAARKELIRLFNLDEDKVCTVGYPVDDIFKPLDIADKQAVKTACTDGKEYFLYHGPISPSRNIITLLKAFSLFKKRQLSNMHLVLAGSINWPGTSFTEKLGTYKFRKDVQVLPSLDNPDMAKVVASAYAMILPSGKEGFSVSQLQALHCGTPVISAAAHPEPGYDAVLRANADSPEEIASQMKLLYKDENLRSELINRGNLEKKQFTTTEVCAKIWSCISPAVEIPDLNLTS